MATHLTHKEHRLTAWFATLGAVFLMAFCLVLTPLGFPGNWLMLAILGVGAWLGEVPSWAVVVLAAMAGLAEVAEYLIVKHTSARYGGSRAAFWGAIGGGLIGVLVGMPVPILGPLLAGLIGTFAGAAAVTLWQTRHLPSSGRVAWGAVVGRGLAAAVKTAVGIAILALGATALLVR